MTARGLPKNILVVDEEELRSLHLAVMLKRLEYNVFVARTSEDFLRLVNSLVPHLVILDLGMPPLEGETCLERLKRDARFGMVKVVTKSGELNEGPLIKSLEKGADAFVVEPVNPTLLYRTIQDLTETAPRKVLRLRVVFRVTLRTGHIERHAFATILSEQGMFVRSINPLPVGTSLKLSLDLPSKKPVFLDGEVIYQVKYNRDRFVEPGMGVRFTTIKKEVRDGLRRFVEDHLTGDLDTGLLR